MLCVVLTLSCFQPLAIFKFLRGEAPVPVSLEIDCFFPALFAIPAIIARMRLPDPSPEALTKFHLTMLVLWAGPGMIVTVLWLKESILWVGVMSVYACAIGHFASYDAARAEQQNGS